MQGFLLAVVDETEKKHSRRTLPHCSNAVLYINQVLHNIINSLLFTTKNRELAIFGTELSEIRKKTKPTVASPDLLDHFNAFQDIYNNTNYSPEVIAEKLKNVDQCIIDYAKTCRNGELTTKGFMDSLNHLSFSAKVTQAAFQTLAAVGNMLAGFLFSKAIEFAANAIDNFIHRVEKANDAMRNSVAEYDSAKSNLENINSTLEEQNRQIDALLAKDKLTYAEKKQLEELQAITKELLLQQDIERRRLETTSKEAAEKTVNAYEKQYGKYDISRDELTEKLAYNNFPISMDENDIIGNITGYIKASELLAESRQKLQNATANGEDTTWLTEDVQYNIDMQDDYSQLLDANINDLHEKLAALSDEYDKVIEKQTAGIDLTTSDQDIISTYDAIYNSLKMIYEYKDQNSWNEMEISDIFNTEGIEVTKEELLALAKAGELTPETIEGYTNLSKAIQDSELFCQEGQQASAFCDEMIALSETLDDIDTDLPLSPILDPAAFSKTINSLSSLQSLYIEFTKSADSDKEAFSFDISQIENLRSIFGSICPSFNEFELLATSSSTSAEEMQAAFNRLATEYILSSNMLDGLNESTRNQIVTQLELQGITNASSILTEDVARVFSLAAAQNLSLSDAADKAYLSILKESNASDEARQAIYMLAAAEISYSSTGLDTAGKIKHLEELARAYGDTKTEAVAAAAAERATHYASALSRQGKDHAESYEKALEDELIRINNLISTHTGKNLEMGNQDSEEDKSTTTTLPASTTSTKSATEAIKKETEAMSELNAEMDKLQSAYKSLCDIQDTYNKYGKITVDQYQELTNTGFGFLANLIDENGQLGLNAEAFAKLANAKLQEMQIQLARNAIDTINGIQTEAAATEYLTYANENLRDAALASTEALLYEAQAAARLRGEQQGTAVDQIVQGYEAAKALAGKVDFSFNPSDVESVKESAATEIKDTLKDLFDEQKKLLDHQKSMGDIDETEYYTRLMESAEHYFGGREEYRDDLWDVQEQYHSYLESIKETYNWIESLLSVLTKKTSALIDKAEKFLTWQKKNAMINRAVKAADNEIRQNQNAYHIYMSKANAVKLNRTYVNKIQSGTLSIEEMSNASLSGKIEEYQKWYDMAQNIADTVNSLYDRERDLIRQKLDNVLDYYNDLDGYLSSVTSKVESLISLNDSMGRKSSLADLVKQFAEASDRISASFGQITTTQTVKKEITFEESESVKEAVEHDRKQAAEAIQSQIDSLQADQSGTYTKLLRNIDRQKEKIKAYEEKGWDTKKKKQYEKLLAQLKNYEAQKQELDANATSDTVSGYLKIYTAYQKLLNKEASGKKLTSGELKKKDAYRAQLDALKADKDALLAQLEQDKAIANGTASPSTREETLRKQLAALTFHSDSTGSDTESDVSPGTESDTESGLASSKIYRNLLKAITDTQAKFHALEAKGYDSLTKKQKKTYEKLQKELEAYHAKKKALEDNATAETVNEYDRVYTAWRKLQDKLDAGGNLTAAQWKSYNQYTAQLEDFSQSKKQLIDRLQTELNELTTPRDKTEIIQQEYEKTARDIYDSYQSQIDAISNDITSTRQYQNLLAKTQQLKQKKATKGLSVKEEAELAKHTAQLKALQTGATSTNIADYMSTWEQLYKLQQKLDKNGKLSDTDAAKYDDAKARLEAWNREKQTQISDLADLMQNELDNLSKTYTENITTAESEVNEYYGSLYNLAKQIAEYNLGTLETQLSYLDACTSYYKELVSLYDSFSGQKLNNLLADLDAGPSENTAENVSDKDPYGNTIKAQESLYQKYLETLQNKYDTTLTKIKQYKELLNAMDTNDFEGSMQLFQDAISAYEASGQQDLADKLKSVLQLLNERSENAGSWDEYADEWQNEWNEALASAKTELIGTASSIQEVNDALREVRFSNITDAITELSRTKDILASMSGLIKDDLLYEPDGNLSEFGTAKVALLVSRLENAQSQADEYLSLYRQIVSARDTYSSDQAYEEALHEALQNYYTSLGDASSLHDSIISLMKKESEAECNALNDLISKRKEALQAKKSYYDYDKTIKSKTRDVETLKAQLDALSAVDTAAAKAKKAQLEAQLAEAEESLEETKAEHELTLQTDALDDFLENFRKSMDDASKTTKEILQEQADIIQSAKEMSEGFQIAVDGLKDLAVLGTQIRNGTTDTLTDPQLNAFLPRLNLAENTALNTINTNARPVEINMHYDALLNVEGNVDKDFAGLLPDYLQKACEYTKKDIYRELQILR